MFRIKGSYGISGITDGKFDGLGLTFTVDGAEDKTYVRASLSVKGDYLGALSISSERCFVCVSEHDLLLFLTLTGSK